jgi:hypothetical protein
MNWLACRFEVADEAGEIVFELPFTEVVEELCGILGDGVIRRRAVTAL